jgi:(p)ppGpp synthase/HD superfamily hydrolase
MTGNSAGHIERARAFAIGAHCAIDQKRKYTATPYEVHLEEVADLVARFGGDEAMVAAAWLHDTVEDTAVSLEVIEREFGADVASLVAELTDVSGPGDGNRKKRKAMDRDHTARASPRAKTVKLADICSNLSTVAHLDRGFARVYVPEKEAELEVLGQGDAALFAHAKAAVEAARKMLEDRG